MRKSTSFFLGVLGLIVLASLFASVISRATHAQQPAVAGPDVRVVNKPSEPVPVSFNGTPTVQISNFPPTPFASGQKVKLLLSSLSGELHCTVLEVRGEWIKCPGSISGIKVGWVNAGQVIAIVD